MRVAIIGAGLAGTSLAYCLKKAGASPVIYESSSRIASGASGNPIGLVNPRLSAFRSPESDFYVSAFSQAVRLFDTIKSEIGWNKCGGLHLITDDKKQKRFPQTLENWGWPKENMRFVGSSEATQIAGVKLHHDALYLPDAGYLSPAKLCGFYSKDIEIHTNILCDNLNDIDADAIVLACGLGIQSFDRTQDIPVQHVRGQITQIKSQCLNSLRCNLNFGGYAAPCVNGIHTIGATFQRWLDHTELREEDDLDNIERLQNILLNLNDVKIVNSRASLRTASKDHFPIIGKVQEKLYISTGHGSHGLTTSLAGAYLLTDILLNQPYSQSKASCAMLAPDRFTNINET